MTEKTTFEITIGVVVEAEDLEEAFEIAEQSVGKDATVMTLQLADRSLLGPARKREAGLTKERTNVQ